MAALGTATKSTAFLTRENAQKRSKDESQSEVTGFSKWSRYRPTNLAYSPRAHSPHSQAPRQWRCYTRARLTPSSVQNRTYSHFPSYVIYDLTAAFVLVHSADGPVHSGAPRVCDVIPFQGHPVTERWAIDEAARACGNVKRDYSVLILNTC